LYIALYNDQDALQIHKCKELTDLSLCYGKILFENVTINANQFTLTTSSSLFNIDTYWNEPTSTDIAYSDATEELVTPNTNDIETAWFK